MKIDKYIIKWNLALVGFFAIQAIGIYLTIWYFDLLEGFAPSYGAEILFACLGFVIAVKALSYFVNRFFGKDKPQNPTSVLDEFRHHWLNGNYILSFIIPVLLIPAFIGLFSAFKAQIPNINPFYLDEFLAQADNFVHFGVDPWRITHLLFGGNIFTFIIDIAYILWFPVLFTYTIWQIVHVHFGKDRMQYLLTFVAVWALNGSFFATLFSSVGPVYYDYFLNGAQYYTPLMDRLSEINQSLQSTVFGGIRNLEIQQTLLAASTSEQGSFGAGISAMPSLHVSVSFMLYLAARRENKYIGYFKLLMLFFILIGSVHLGWHYALDGYFSLLATFIIWRACGWLVNRLNVNAQIE